LVVKKMRKNRKVEHLTGSATINPTRDTIEQRALRSNFLQLVHMRGMAFYGHVATILIAYYGLNLVIPIRLMFFVVAFLVGFNLFCFWRYRAGKSIREAELFLGLMVDVLGLTALLYLSGGTSNPFMSLYMIPVIIAAVLVRKTYVWTILLTTLVCYGLISLKREQFTHAPLRVTGGWFDIHVHGLMLAFCLSAVTLVYFVTKITDNLRARDHEIDALSRQIQDEAHMAQVGMLAAGAAHELGTPLTTLSVILNDWLALGPPKNKRALMGELHTLSDQVARCKSIVSDTLSHSGQTRGEAARAQALHEFIAQTLRRWQADHNPPPLVQTCFEGADIAIAAETVLAQAVYNLLQNALEANQDAGRDGIRLRVHSDGQNLCIAITDNGAGFSDAQLAKIGEPFNSTKRAVGRGMGLFLVKNVTRRLGGRLEARNDTPTGATVHMVLPRKNLEISP
jgi:two-component system sensor histidine kinase RegB